MQDTNLTGRMLWEVWDRREIVGHHATKAEAVRACRNDMGRALIVYDPTGRIAVRMRDGRDLDAEAVAR